MLNNDKLNGGSTSVSGLSIALSGYTILFIGKLTTYFFTGIGVMYAEALHSMADMLISSFLLIAAIWSRRPADQHYRYGYGRAQNIAALVAATVFLSFTSLETFRSAIAKLISGSRPVYSNINLGLIVTLFAILISALPLIKILLSKERGAATKAQFIESINDEIALLAALAGIVFIKQGIPVADAIASIIVAIIIAINAASLWIENARSLMGRSPDASFYRQVEAIAKSVYGVVDVHDLNAEFIGNEVRLGIHIEVPKSTPIEAADQIAERVHDEITEKIGNIYCVVHTDPEGVKN